MAKRRMLSIEVLETDLFYRLPPSSQIIYLHFNMNADDDGFVGNVNNLVRAIGAERKYLRLLVESGYLIEFDSGVVAITHWHVNNKVRIDRYTPTRHTKEREMLTLDKDLVYTRNSGDFG